MKILAAFDFDGTLTRKDSFLLFVAFTRGRRILLWGLIRHIHLLVLMKLGLYPNGKIKERIFGYFFKGCKKEWFEEKGRAFAGIIDDMINPASWETLGRHQAAGHTIYVITASIEDWVAPWCHSHGIHHILGTQVEKKDGKLTGRFCTLNCYGKQKVIRLMEHEPDRSGYFLYAYGDSRGDRELLDFADEKHLLR